MHTLDIELTASDIQALSGADAIAAFFARLGYHTATRTLQTPANLGATADGTVRPIKSIELIADQEGLFQIYFFELTSITVAHTRALARAFRNRAGNYLLIITTDYEHLDSCSWRGTYRVGAPMGVLSDRGRSVSVLMCWRSIGASQIGLNSGCFVA